MKNNNYKKHKHNQHSNKQATFKNPNFFIHFFLEPSIKNIIGISSSKFKEISADLTSEQNKDDAKKIKQHTISVYENSRRYLKHLINNNKEILENDTILNSKPLNIYNFYNDDNLISLLKSFISIIDIMILDFRSLIIKDEQKEDIDHKKIETIRDFNSKIYKNSVTDKINNNNNTYIIEKESNELFMFISLLVKKEIINYFFKSKNFNFKIKVNNNINNHPIMNCEWSDKNFYCKSLKQNYYDTINNYKSRVIDERTTINTINNILFKVLCFHVYQFNNEVDKQNNTFKLIYRHSDLIDSFDRYHDADLKQEIIFFKSYKSRKKSLFKNNIFFLEEKNKTKILSEVPSISIFKYITYLNNQTNEKGDSEQNNEFGIKSIGDLFKQVTDYNKFKNFINDYWKIYDEKIKSNNQNKIKTNNNINKNYNIKLIRNSYYGNYLKTNNDLVWFLNIIKHFFHNPQNNQTTNIQKEQINNNQTNKSTSIKSLLSDKLRICLENNDKGKIENIITSLTKNINNEQTKNKLLKKLSIISKKVSIDEVNKELISMIKNLDYFFVKEYDNKNNDVQKYDVPFLFKKDYHYLLSKIVSNDANFNDYKKIYNFIKNMYNQFDVDNSLKNILSKSSLDEPIPYKIIDSIISKKYPNNYKSSNEEKSSKDSSQKEGIKSIILRVIDNDKKFKNYENKKNKLDKLVRYINPLIIDFISNENINNKTFEEKLNSFIEFCENKYSLKDDQGKMSNSMRHLNDKNNLENILNEWKYSETQKK